MTRARPRSFGIVLAVLVAAWLAVVLGGCGPRSAASESQSAASESEPSPTLIEAPSLPTTGPSTSLPPTGLSPSLPATDPASGLPFIDPADLPPEALDTLRLIEADGPFPFDRDGITFQNREELLPDERSGYYREFTVITPGLSHRGTRRIVAGEAGERYYTADHYESFQRVRPSGTDP